MSEVKNRKIILVDSNNIAYRAFYALPPSISTSTGIQTNAVYGFTAMLLKLIEEQKPQNVICAFDCKGPTFRHDISEEYKATRKKMPDELSGQMKIIKEVLEALNISTLEMEGYEADDIIATLSLKVKNDFDKVLIVSSDKDILQLISENIYVISLRKGITDTVLYDSEKVREKFGVNPENIRDLLALMGDSSDNIPGVPGIGPKTAQEIISEFGNIKSIYENIEKVKSEKLKNLLISEKSSAEKSLKLANLDYNLRFDLFSILERKVSSFDHIKAENIFDSLEFRTLKSRLAGIKNIYSKNHDKDVEKNDKGKDFSSGSAEQQEKTTVRKIRTKYNLYYNEDPDNKIIRSFKNNVFISYWANLNEHADTASGNLKGQEVFPENPEEYLIIFNDSGDFFIYNGDFLSAQDGNKGLKKILCDVSVLKSGFDFKHIFKFLKRNNIVIKGSIEDFKIQYLLLNPVKTDASLNEVCAGLINNYGSDYEGIEVIFNNSLTGQLPNLQVSLEDVLNGRNPGESFEKIKDFIVREARFFPELYSLFLNKIKSEGLSRLYYEIEAPLIEVLAEMEYKGVNIDQQYLKNLIREYESDIKDLTDQIYSLCNTSFNINSTQQLSKVLYRDLKLTPAKKTKTGFSTDAATLISLSRAHPVIEKILDYREKVKLKNTYLDVLPNIIDPSDKRIHATYNQLGTTTGRISSNNPNLQNIPIRTELGKQIRKAFIPGAGYDMLISADYSQIELRLLAHLSGDKDLIDAFNSGVDIHSKTASEIFGVDYSRIDENLRRKAKAINFGILYGMTEYGLKNRLDISEEEARAYIKLYFDRYPNVKNYISSLISTAYKTGFAVTMFGRKRYIKELASTNANIRNLGERLAVNTPIQGSAADIMKLATVKIFRRIKEQSIDANIILHVHDEIVLELKHDDKSIVEHIVKDSMENTVLLKTILKVDVETGKSWFLS